MGRTKTAVDELYSSLENHAKPIGLEINVNKTKSLIQSSKQTEERSFLINNTEIEIVDRFVYLGSTLTRDNNEMAEIKRRLWLANRAYYSMLNLFKSRTLHRESKLRIYKTIVRPILCYGSETWKLTRREEDMLDKFERKILRRIYGPKLDGDRWRIRYNEEIYDMYKDIKVTTFIKIQRLQWAGHLIRMDENRIPKKVLQQTIYGKRRRGKPKRRWEEAVREDAESLLKVKPWKTKAKDRDFWRRCINEAKARFGL